MNIIIETPRLYLREFTEADIPLIQQLNNDPAVVKYLHEPLLDTEEKARAILVNNILPQYKLNLGRWATFIKSTGEFIGWCGLKHRPELEEIDLGYRFAVKYWGKGYATEAAQAVLDHALNVLKLETVTGRAHIENAGSLKVLEKIGMKYIKDEVVDDCPVKTFVVVNPGI
ncbi:MAG: GNAT family N-acetyltransferase [Ferruginibacter sp.]